MKFNKQFYVLVGVVATCCVVSFSSAVFAGAIRCEVGLTLVGAADTAGPVITAKMIGGSCPGWGSNLNNNFILTQENQKTMLAIILTAQTLEKSIFIHSLDDNFANWKTMHQVYIGNVLNN